MKLIKVLLLVLGLFILAGSQAVGAQEETPEEIAAKYGVTFPIEELGGCTDYTACRSYCDDPLHYENCVAFAKEKGFYQDSEEEEAILTRAKQTLGCTSYESCQSFCEEEKNYDRCHRFAESVGVSGGYQEDPRSKKFLNEAKEELGCDSYQSCQSFCDNPTNRDKCAEFAKKMGVSGGYKYSGPGGCTSEDTCRDFCSNPDNYQVCQQYAQTQSSQEFTGPGGCNSEDSCRAYCEKNPRACGMTESDQSLYSRYSDPQTMCSKTPGCNWQNNTCICTGTTTTTSPSETNYDPATGCKKYGCSWTGTYCQCQKTEDYQEKWKSECSQYEGCSWTGSECRCSNSPKPSYTPYPTSNYTPYPTSYSYPTPPYYEGSSGDSYTVPTPMPTYNYDPATECARQSGCSWNGSSCQCSSSSGSSGGSSPEGSSGGSSETTTAPDPATECSKYPGCSWTDGGCQCTAVQGAKSSNWLRQLLDLVRSSISGFRVSP